MPFQCWQLKFFPNFYEDRDLGTLLHIHQTRRNRDAPDGCCSENYTYSVAMVQRSDSGLPGRTHQARLAVSLQQPLHVLQFGRLK